MISNSNQHIEAFKILLNSLLAELHEEADLNPGYYANRAGVLLEEDVCRILNKKAVNTIFEGKIERISGQKFPDIVIHISQTIIFGLEVKTTKTNTWKSTGNSIFEGTRVKNIENIFLLFGKLSEPIKFKCKKYEKCLSEVTITHSPRYLIDMNIQENESIFSKVGIQYNTLRKLEQPFKPLKRYYRKQLSDGDGLWWLESKNNNSRLKIKHWKNLTKEEKQNIKIAAIAYFPVLLSNKNTKYMNVSAWLVSEYNVVNHALRDAFSAGGQITFNSIRFPKIFNYVLSRLDEVLLVVKNIDIDDAKHYWDVDLNKSQLISNWKRQCIHNGKSILDSKQMETLIAHLKRYK
ncbi:MAG: hypothetical protein AB8B80_03670 [Marinicellaceae bacterium]